MSGYTIKNESKPEAKPKQLSAELQNAAGFYKVTSDITMSQILENLSHQEAKDYCKYLQLSYQNNQSKKNLVDSIVTTLTNHPQYCLYVLEEKELHELLRLMQCKTGKLEEQPDIDSIIKGMSLGLVECVCTDKNNIQTAQIAFSKEAETILTSLKPAAVRKEYKKLYSITDRICLLLQPYGTLDMDTLYEKYCYYWGNELNREDLLRVAYWHCRFCNYAQMAEYGIDKKSYIALTDINMMEVLSDITEYAQDIPYKLIDKETLMQWSHGFCNVYETWDAYEEYLRETAHIKDEMLPAVIESAFSDTVSGHSASYLITESLKVYQPQTPRYYIDLWMIFMSIAMETGIVGLKGYSRTEYLKLKGELPAKFALIDADITSSDIKKRTHLYEMPSKIQEKVYDIFFMPPEDSVRELTDLISNIKAKNEELLTLLEDFHSFNREFEEMEENLARFKELDDSAYESDFLPPWLSEEKQEPYRREGVKIGRNDPCPCGSGKKYKNCCGKNK